jgi:PAS domain S-box-containing protein
MKSGRSLQASRLALAMAIIVVISLPLGFFVLGYQRLSIILETEADANAHFASQIINANPEYWPFEDDRLQEFLSRPLSPAASEVRRIRKLNGELVAQNQDEVRDPVIVRSHDLHDYGKVVGKLEIVRSLRPLLWETALVGVLGGLLIAAIYLLLRRYVLSVREEAQKGLQESERRYRLLAENVTDVIWTMNFNLKMTYVSPSVELLRGFSVQETLRQELEEILTPASLELALNTYNEGLAYAQQGNPDRNRVWTLDLEHTRKDGTTIWAEVHARFMYDDAGRPTGILGVTRNIAGRKRAENLLRGEKERYQTLVESAPIGISAIDKDGRYRYVNPKFVEIFGYTLDDVPTGKDWFAKAYPDAEYRRQVKAAWKADLEKAGQGEVRPRTLNVTSRDGSIKIINFKSLTLENDDQLVLYEDVTVRRQAQEALEQAKKEWEEIFQAIGHPTVIINADGSLQAANRATLKALGGSASEVLNKKCYEIFHHSQQPPAACPVEKMRQSGRWETVEMEIEALGGIYLVSCTPVFDAQGRLQKIFHIATDISHRKRAEEELQQYKEHLENLVQERTAQLTWANEKLQREILEHRDTEKKLQNSLAEKEVLLREIHHRVKNNLQIISSLLNLQLTYPGKKTAQEILADSQNRLQTMALIHESLYLSQDLARIQFVRYLREMLGRLLQIYKTPDQEIKAAVEGDEVHLDITRAVPCALIANELLTNALKHAFPGGREGEILVTMKAVDESFELRVQDNGVGLPANADLKNNSKLGLQIVGTLVNQLGGTINYAGNGRTEFILRF